MAINFPDAPTNGQKHTVAGLPTYTYDGEKWTTLGTDVGSADAVRYNTPQVLTETQQRQARVNVYAAPMDALAYSGMQVNGSMEVSQELGTAGRSTAGYVCDGWVFANSSTASITVATSTGSINQGLPSFLNTNVTVAQVTLTTTQAASFYQFIEGYRTSRLAWGTGSPQPITIGFWSAHTRTGTYSVAVRNGSDNRSYVTTYTQGVADTWEYKTVTIPGDTTGTWNQFNTIGMTLQFAMACGPTYTAPAANTWYGTLYIAAPGQVNAVTTTSDRFRLAGVVVLPGNEAPSATRSPYIMRPYGEELLLCQRYFRLPTGGIQVIATVGGNNYGGYSTFGQSMRIIPTVAFITYIIAPANISGSATAGLISADGFLHYALSNSTGPTQYHAQFKADARL